MAEYLARFQIRIVNYRSSCFRKLNFGVLVSQCGEKTLAKGKLPLTTPLPSQVMTYEKRIPRLQLRNATTDYLFVCMEYRKVTTPSSTVHCFRC